MKILQDTLDRIEAIKIMVLTAPEESLMLELLQIDCMKQAAYGDNEEFIYLCDRALEIIGNKMEEITLGNLISSNK